MLSQRRGPVGALTASCANLETPLPLIDIVNECLEYLAAAAPPANGTVYDTSGDELAGHELCAGNRVPTTTRPRGATILSACSLRSRSTPRPGRTPPSSRPRSTS